MSGVYTSSPKEICHHFLTLVSSQTCMTYFLLWNTKEDFFAHAKSVGSSVLQNIIFCVPQKNRDMRMRKLWHQWHQTSVSMGFFKVWSLWKVIAHLCSTICMIWAINQGKACRLENVSCQHLLFWGYFIVTRFNRFWKPAKRYLKRVINLFFCTIIIIWGSFEICRFINPII